MDHLKEQQAILLLSRLKTGFQRPKDNGRTPGFIVIG